jgi:Repeat of unknown function (DUF5648)
MNDFPSPPSENCASTKQKRMFSGFLVTIIVKIFFVIALLLSITTVSALGQTKQAHANSLGLYQPSPFYRLYNGTDHFYTADRNEAVRAQNGGYKYEGLAGYIGPSDDVCVNMRCGSLYRLYNGTDHFYTADWNEALSAASGGYKYEGVAGVVCLASCTGGLTSSGGYTYKYVPLYRLYNKVDHFYTTNAAEVYSAENGGYAYEGLTGYIYARYSNT